MILYAVNQETISALIAGGGTASAIGENLWEVQSAAPITPGPGYLVLPSADARLPALAAAKRAEIRAAQNTAVDAALGSNREQLRALTEAAYLTSLVASGQSLTTEQSALWDALIGAREMVTLSEAKEAAAMAAVDAAEAANDRAALLAVTWANN